MYQSQSPRHRSLHLEAWGSGWFYSTCISRRFQRLGVLHSRTLLDWEDMHLIALHNRRVEYARLRLVRQALNTRNMIRVHSF